MGYGRRHRSYERRRAAQISPYGVSQPSKTSPEERAQKERPHKKGKTRDIPRGICRYAPSAYHHPHRLRHRRRPHLLLAQINFRLGRLITDRILLGKDKNADGKLLCMKKPLGVFIRRGFFLFILFEIAVEQAFERLAVASLVASHLVHGVVDGVKSLFLCALREFCLALCRAVLRGNSRLEVLLCGR